MGKKKEIREMANLVGNSAAHIALLFDREFALKEVTTYTEDAADTASSRTWSHKDISDFKILAMRRATSEIKDRIIRYGFPSARLGDFLARAEIYITAFASNHIEGRH